MVKAEKAEAIKLTGIRKTFGSVIANDSVDLTVRYGEIMALLGENGSGKTTLMNMLSGIYHPDRGSIAIRGKEVSIHSPMDAMKYGIGMIHQHFKLVDVFNAMDNIVLGTKGKYEKPQLMKQKIEQIRDKYGLKIEMEKKIYNMSVSEKQTVEVLKVLYRGADILILDEPTAVLTLQETRKLFAILKKMREQGSAIIIITHKLNEVMEISDKVTILRKGKSIRTVVTAHTNEDELTELMVGEPINWDIERPQVENKKTMLDLKNITVEKQDKTIGLNNVSFRLMSGEILGVAGIAGSGQKELCESITGLIKIKSGEITHKGNNIIEMNPAEREQIGLQIGFVPEDRLGMGLVGSMGMVDNVLLKSYQRQKGFFIKKKEAKQTAKALVKELKIVTAGINAPVRMMSGGNVQKVLLGREIQLKPNVLVTAYPVRGLDVNSSYAVYDMLNKEKKDGAAVLFVGEDIDVLLAISDRILVLCHGEITGIVDAKQTTKEQIGLMMTGKSIEEVH